MSARELLDDFRENFGQRRFAAGLLLAFIAFFRELNVFGRGYRDFSAFLEEYPLSQISARGGRANTLVVEVRQPGEAVPKLASIRPAYNAAETRIRVEHRRYDYPNCAPHATGQWHDYRHWLDALVTLSPSDAEWLADAVEAHVLSVLPSHDVDYGELPPLERSFSRLLEGFDLAKQGREPPGAAFQGAVYAYIRADAPHLHLEVARAGAGSKRLGRVGDIDGWDGERLVLSVEVKHYSLDGQSAAQVGPFLAEVTRRNALAIVAAQALDAPATRYITDCGGRVLDVPSLLQLVDLWDPIKQRAAVQAFVYYVHHIEKKKPLIDRLAAFLRAQPQQM